MEGVKAQAAGVGQGVRHRTSHRGRAGGTSRRGGAGALTRRVFSSWLRWVLSASLRLATCFSAFFLSVKNWFRKRLKSAPANFTSGSPDAQHPRRDCIWTRGALEERMKMRSLEWASETGQLSL